MKDITRRSFLTKSAGIGIGFCLPAIGLSESFFNGNSATGSEKIFKLKRGEKQIFVDDVMISKIKGLERKVHPAQKLSNPVLEGDKPWEFFEDQYMKIPYAALYGTVLRDEKSGLFRMWYNVHKKSCYAESVDGINWEKPVLHQVGETNMLNLFDFHSPSIIFDKKETDPAKRYKAIGSKEGFSKEEINKLKAKFNSPEWYKRRHAYCYAYSPDGITWTMAPEPILMGMDTITFAQDLVSGEYLAFHKQTKDPRSFGRQVFLSTSNDMQTWSFPELAMSTDETDHKAARKLESGTHAEFYNMSAFYYGSQWLGMVTRFRCIGEPLENGKARAGQKGIIDVQLVHSRDGKNWKRCSDRSPIVPAGPYEYDNGMVFGICNTPVIVGDEMWMYYSGSTDIHCCSDNNTKVSIGRAVWRLDGMVSMHAGDKEGFLETATFLPEGNNLIVNANVLEGSLAVEVLDAKGNPLEGYSKKDCLRFKGNEIYHQIKWKRNTSIPSGKPIRLRFCFSNGDLYSYNHE